MGASGAVQGLAPGAFSPSRSHINNNITFKKSLLTRPENTNFIPLQGNGRHADHQKKKACPLGSLLITGLSLFINFKASWIELQTKQ